MKNKIINLLICQVLFLFSTPPIIKAETHMEGVQLEKNVIYNENHSAEKGVDVNNAGGEIDSCSLIVFNTFDTIRNITKTVTKTTNGEKTCAKLDTSGSIQSINDACRLCEQRPYIDNYNYCFNSTLLTEALILKNDCTQTILNFDVSDKYNDWPQQCGYSTINHGVIDNKTYSELSIKTICRQPSINIKELIIVGFASVREVASSSQIMINNLGPIEQNQLSVNNSWEGTLTWKIPVLQECGGTIYLKLNNPKGQINITSIQAVTETCDLKISDFNSSTDEYSPSSGSKITFFGNIEETTGKAIKWAVTIAGKTFSGSGKSVSVVWDGKDANGNPMPEGTYTATLSTQTSDGRCSDTKNVQVTVRSSCKFDIIVEPSEVWPQKTKSSKTTSTVKISLANPAPPNGCVIDLRVEPVTKSGGHGHTGNRPKGGVSPSQVIISNGETGPKYAKYTSSEVSGEERIIGECNGNEAKATLSIKVPNLTPFSGSNSRLTGQTSKHNDNHYGTTNTIQQTIKMAIDFYNEFNATLGINDMSLPQGGIFDIDGTWSPPHSSHRKGTSVDIDSRALGPNGMIKVERKYVKGLCEWYKGYLVPEATIHCEFKK